MICIRCNKDSNYPERTGQRCPHCRGAFAFEPRTGDPLSDVAFAALIKKVSADEGVRWGVEHLYYEYCRRHKVREKGVSTFFTVIGVLAVPLTVIVAWVHPMGFASLALSAVTVGAFWVGRSGHSARVGVTWEVFFLLWKKWLAAHGTPAGLIERPSMPTQPTPVAEADLGDYSFDRAVICDRARTADLLLANNFHFENNCAILSSGGYPQVAFAQVRKMLRRNPRLEVYVLHDATPAGCGLAHKIAHDANWFPRAKRIIDVGLRPIHAPIFRGAFQPPDPAIPSLAGISPLEQKWLAKHSLELAVVRPEQVIKRLFRAMTTAREPGGEFELDWDADGDEGTDVDDAGDRLSFDEDAFSADADASDGGGDGFG